MRMLKTWSGWRGIGSSASEGSSASGTDTAVGGLARSALSISNPLLLTVIDIVARSFAVKVESIDIAVLTFFGFHFIKEVKVHWVPSR
jgi:hypothetical protein